MRKPIHLVGVDGVTPNQIFVNLPVRDLDRSVAFFTKLGYSFNPQFTSENGTCMILGENMFAMLLVEKYFETFTPKPVADASKVTEVLVALSFDSREEVERLVDAAVAAGARRHKEPVDFGWMLQSGFEDLDGHMWEYFWMDSNGPPADAASS